MSTYTRTGTETKTYARHIAAKMATDLKRLQRLMECEEPSDQDIADYQQEAIALLRRGYLGEVIYGFKRNNKWVVALKYKSVNGTLYDTGDDPGGIRRADISGTRFSSFLSYSQIWHNLSTAEKNEFKQSLPFQRTSAEEPGIENGYWADNRKYISGDLGVQRSMIERYK